MGVLNEGFYCSAIVGSLPLLVISNYLGNTFHATEFSELHRYFVIKLLYYYDCVQMPLLRLRLLVECITTRNVSQCDVITYYNSYVSLVPEGVVWSPKTKDNRNLGSGSFKSSVPE